MITGWYDWCLDDTLQTWEALAAFGRDPVRARSRLLITPSAHDQPGYHEGRAGHRSARPGRRASRTSGSGAGTVALPPPPGQHRDTGDRSGRPPQLSGGTPMYAPTDHVPPPAPPRRSALERLLIRPREYRQPRRWTGIRVACGIFNVLLGVGLLAFAPELGALTWLAALPLAGAGLIFWTVYRLRRDTVQG
jgi:hypothetical protein